MLRRFVCAGALIGLAAAAVLAADTPKFQLRGDRFRPLTYEQMTPEQRTLIDHLLSGPRGSVNGPFNVMLRSPELGDLQQAIGAYVRYRTSIPHKLNELAILMIGRHWNAQYEWYAHKRIALEAGLSPAIIADMAVGKRPANLQPDEEIVYNFTRELNETKEVSDATFKAAVEKFGERGVVDLVGTLGLLSPRLDAAQSGPLSAAGGHAARAAGIEVRAHDEGTSSSSLLRRHGLCASFRRAVSNVIR